MPILDAFTGVFTAKQIVAQAERRANHPGLNLANDGSEPNTAAELLEAPAYASLQAHLDHLALVYTWPYMRTVVNIPITGIHNALPLQSTYGVSFWRVGFSDPVFIINPSSGSRSRLQIIDAERFHTLIDPSGQRGEPQFGYINRAPTPSPGYAYLSVYPTPDKTYTAEIHCYPWQAALATVDSKPWFPYSQYLVYATLVDAYFLQDDGRKAEAEAKADKLMKQIRASLGDERSYSGSTIKLDPEYYRPPLEF